MHHVRTSGEPSTKVAFFLNNVARAGPNLYPDMLQSRSRPSSSHRYGHQRPRFLSHCDKTGRRYPPAPSVEDESDSLTRECNPSVIPSDEQPIFVGQIEQNPLILDVPANEGERRFVLVTQPEDNPPERVNPLKVDYPEPPQAKGEETEKISATGQWKPYPETPTTGASSARREEQAEKDKDKGKNKGKRREQLERRKACISNVSVARKTSTTTGNINNSSSSSNSSSNSNAGKSALANFSTSVPTHAGSCASASGGRSSGTASRSSPATLAKVTEQATSYGAPEREMTVVASPVATPEKKEDLSNRVPVVEKTSAKLHQRVVHIPPLPPSPPKPEAKEEERLNSRAQKEEELSTQINLTLSDRLPVVEKSSSKVHHYHVHLQKQGEEKPKKQATNQDNLRKDWVEERPSRLLERRQDRLQSYYEANTCRKYVLVPNSGGNSKPVSPTRQKLKERKSRQRLPPLDTESLEPEIEPRKSARYRRSTSAAEIKQDDPAFLDSEDAPHHDDDFSSPNIVRKHSTSRQRDENYHENSRGGGWRYRKSLHDPGSMPTGVERAKDREAHASSPTRSRTPSAKNSRRETLREFRESGELRQCEWRDLSPDQYFRTRYDYDAFPAHPIRTATGPAYKLGSLGDAAVVDSPSRDGRTPTRSRSLRRCRGSPASDAVGSSSEDEYIPYPRTPPRRKSRLSIVDPPEERGFLLMPPVPSSVKGSESTGSFSVTSARPVGTSFAGQGSSGLRGASTSSGVGEPDYPELERSHVLPGREESPLPPHRRDDLVDYDDYRRDRPRSRGSGPRLSASMIANPFLEGRSWTPSSDPSRHSTSLFSRWKLPPFTSHEARALTYKNYLLGVADRIYESLPACPNTKKVTGYRGWLTLPRCEGFTICPSCFEHVFEHTEYAPKFRPMPMLPSNIEVACSFGSSYWYQIAWFETLKHNQPDLRILMTLADTIADNRPCPGIQVCNEIWYSIRDPLTRCLVPSFTICYTCVQVVGALLPTLAKVFEPLSSKPKNGMCSLRCESSSKDTKFLDYFDALESVADVSMKNRIPADMQELSDKLQLIVTVNNCPKDLQIWDKCWFFMRSLDDLTVCRECFLQVVKPWIDEGNLVARDFYALSRYVPVATCQLYSRRMRDVFDKACDRRGIEYLEAKVKERKIMENDISSRIRMLVSKPVLTSREEDELDRLTVEWAEWE